VKMIKSKNNEEVESENDEKKNIDFEREAE
jgi:hypothetical protein